MTKAMEQALKEVTHYPQPKSVRLCEAVAELERTAPSQVICGNGAADILFSLVLAEKPKKALLLAPTFQEYEQALLSVDCQVERVDMLANKLFWEVFIERITRDINMVFLCNPNNPTGELYNRKTLERVLEKCTETGTRLVIDECFLDFVREAENITMKPFLDLYPQIVIVKAFTKMFAIPGIRIGYGLSSDYQLLEKMRSVTQPWNVSVIAQETGMAAAKETGFVERTRIAIEEEKQFLLQELKQLPLEIQGHAANFIFFRGEKGLDKKLEQHGILIRNCSNFHGLEEGWYRIAVQSHKENQVLIQALQAVIEST